MEGQIIGNETENQTHNETENQNQIDNFNGDEHNDYSDDVITYDFDKSQDEFNNVELPSHDDDLYDPFFDDGMALESEASNKGHNNDLSFLINSLGEDLRLLEGKVFQTPNFAPFCIATETVSNILWLPLSSESIVFVHDPFGLIDQLLGILHSGAKTTSIGDSKFHEKLLAVLKDGGVLCIPDLSYVLGMPDILYDVVKTFQVGKDTLTIDGKVIQFHPKAKIFLCYVETPFMMPYRNLLFYRRSPWVNLSISSSELQDLQCLLMLSRINPKLGDTVVNIFELYLFVKKQLTDHNKDIVRLVSKLPTEAQTIFDMNILKRLEPVHRKQNILVSMLEILESIVIALKKIMAQVFCLPAQLNSSIAIAFHNYANQSGLWSCNVNTRYLVHKTMHMWKHLNTADQQSWYNLHCFSEDNCKIPDSFAMLTNRIFESVLSKLPDQHHRLIIALFMAVEARFIDGRLLGLLGRSGQSDYELDDLLESISPNTVEQFHIMLQNHSDEFKDWMSCSAPEETPLPFENLEDVNLFEVLLIIAVVRPDRTPYALNKYIEQVLRQPALTLRVTSQVFDFRLRGETSTLSSIDRDELAHVVVLPQQLADEVPNTALVVTKENKNKIQEMTNAECFVMYNVDLEPLTALELAHQAQPYQRIFLLSSSNNIFSVPEVIRRLSASNYTNTQLSFRTWPFAISLATKSLFFQTLMFSSSLVDHEYPVQTIMAMALSHTVITLIANVSSIRIPSMGQFSHAVHRLVEANEHNTPINYIVKSIVSKCYLHYCSPSVFEQVIGNIISEFFNLHRKTFLDVEDGLPVPCTELQMCRTGSFLFENDKALNKLIDVIQDRFGLSEASPDLLPTFLYDLKRICKYTDVLTLQTNTSSQLAKSANYFKSEIEIPIVLHKNVELCNDVTATSALLCLEGETQEFLRKKTFIELDRLDKVSKGTYSPFILSFYFLTHLFSIGCVPFSWLRIFRPLEWLSSPANGRGKAIEKYMSSRAQIQLMETISCGIDWLNDLSMQKKVSSMHKQFNEMNLPFNCITLREMTIYIALFNFSKQYNSANIDDFTVVFMEERSVEFFLEVTKIHQTNEINTPNYQVERLFNFTNCVALGVSSDAKYFIHYQTGNSLIFDNLHGYAIHKTILKVIKDNCFPIRMYSDAIRNRDQIYYIFGYEFDDMSMNSGYLNTILLADVTNS
eukprot:TRINITY_DN3231_c3_g4_i1.p1 TRINITY_DN3231_c3_g4~~TRINITY_DN3231_c3_g4_i1.p1  ORF type:complete len:1358 (+),score=328.49 TRINITY_DN3231_c3_g4_i1:513-4076(+)